MSESVRHPLRVGVVGCGRVFERFHLPALSRIPTIQLVAACDTDPHRRRWAEALPSRPLLFGSLEELLRAADVEALLVSTPPSTHAEAAVRAVEAGLHVLVEKPMALDPGEGVRMVRAASQAQRRLQVGFSRRFRPPYQRLRERLRRLESRPVKEARFELAFPTASWKAQTDFLGDSALGGGVLDDVLSHQVDLICWLLGRPDEVKAEVAASPGGGVRAELRVGGVNVLCTAAHAGYAERLEVELVGGSVLEASGSRLRSGSRSFRGWRRRRALLMDRVSLISDRLLGRANITLASFETQLRDFERAIRGGRSEGASGEDGLLAIDIVEACRTSARNGGAWQRLKLSARPAA